MNEDKLKIFLKNADQNAGRPSPVEFDISAIRKRAKHKSIYKIVYPSAAAAAIVIFAICMWSSFSKNTEPENNQKILASDIEAKINQLHESANNILNMIEELNEKEQGQKRLSALKAELASIPDPIQQVNEELDRTAFTLVFAADKMYQELNLTDSAVETYKRVIKLFPDNQWAQVARERLKEIQKRNNNDSSKGESKWQQNTLS